MAIIYKTLFEVKLLHEFYLTRPDGSTIFNLPNQADRINFLLNQFTLGEDSINGDISYEFPEDEKEIYEGLGLKLLSSYSGFKIVARVTQKKLSDGTTVFQTSLPFSEDFGINVLITKKDNAIDGYTNGRVQPSLPLAYLFSTEKIIDDKVFPYLTSAVQSLQSTYSYEQGELVAFGANDLRAYYLNAAGDQWDSCPGGAFANENDRLLLPTRFRYAFPSSPEISSAQFVLNDIDGNEVQSISFSGTKPMKNALLDFSRNRDTLNIPSGSTLSKNIFSLSVDGDNGYSEKFSVVFSDSSYQPGIWAMVNIQTSPSNALFNFIASDGFIVKRKSAVGIWAEAPVFEIPIKSRFTYWRFINDRGKKLQRISDLQDYLDVEDGILLTKRPRSAARSFFLLKKAGSTDTKYVPNPENYNIVKDDKQRICLDVIVPRSALFPIVP